MKWVDSGAESPLVRLTQRQRWRVAWIFLRGPERSLACGV